MTPYGAVCVDHHWVREGLSADYSAPSYYMNFIPNSSVTDHYNDVIMSAIVSQITSLTIVCSSDYSATDQRKHQSTSKLCVTGLCEGNSPGTGEFPAQKASNAENASIWWRHHVTGESTAICFQYQYLCTFYFVRGQHANDTTTKPLSCDLCTNSTDQQCLIMWSSGCSWFNGITEGNMYCAVT